MTTMTAKIARRVLRYERALPILQPSMRRKVAVAARRWIARGWRPTQQRLLAPVDWTRVHAALIRLALADLPAVITRDRTGTWKAAA